MGTETHIEWCDHTFNPWMGCTKVSAGCAHCYAETLMDARYGRVQWGKGNARSRTSEANWKLPLRWNAVAARLPRPRVFCASLADWLDEAVPIAWLADLLKLIHDTPHLDWLLLTKRPEHWFERIEAAGDHHFDYGDRNVTGWLQDWRKHGIPPANIWFGTSVEDQENADQRIPELLRIPARVRFLSCEPLLGPIDLRRAPLDWVIVGGESGPAARPMHVAWVRSLRYQCQAAGAAFFFKQWGEWFPWENRCDVPTAMARGEVKLIPDGSGHIWRRIGKRAAGCVLDGGVHHAFPEVRG